eukprot:scaffold62294_cov38-Cyclotella_meneghiniana.AAC.1
MSLDHPNHGQRPPIAVQTLPNPTTTITNVFGTGGVARGVYSALIHSTQSPPRLPQELGLCLACSESSCGTAPLPHPSG